MIVFSPESPSSQTSVIEKLPFQLIKLEIWHLLLSHFIHPLSLSPICSTFQMFQISTILPIITSHLTWILTSSPALCIFFPILSIHRYENIVSKSFFLIKSFYSKTTNGLSAIYRVKLKFLRLLWRLFRPILLIHT